MSYNLAFSIEATADLTITPTYIDINGDSGTNVTITNQFVLGTWYGLTLSIASAYQGYIGFYDQSNNLLALYAVNPQEAENLDVKVSSVNSIGPGGYPFTYCVKSTSNLPIAGAQVWITTDPGGRNVIAGTLISDSTGNVTFEIPSGNYYLWVIAPSYTFPNPKIITVQ